MNAMKKTRKNANITVKNIRFANTEKVIECLLRDKQKMRSELAKENHISLMTIKHIVDALIAGGIVRETVLTDTELGRKPKILELSKQYGSIVCINLTGRCKISFLIYDVYENLIGEGSREFTEQDNYRDILLGLLDDVKKCLKKLPLELIGIGVFVPSAYYEDEDLVNYDLIEHFKNLHLKALLKQEFDIENVMIIHDVFSAAKSEYDSAHLESESQFYCYFGTGVGGFFIHDNTPVMGKDLMAGEIGKMLVADENGRWMTFEDIASVEAVSRRAAKMKAAKSFDKCVEKYITNNVKAKTCLTPVLDTIVKVIYNLLCIYNPDRVVIDSCCRLYSKIIADYVYAELLELQNEAIPIQAEIIQAVHDEYHTMRGCFQMVRAAWVRNTAERNSN